MRRANTRTPHHAVLKAHRAVAQYPALHPRTEDKSHPVDKVSDQFTSETTVQ